VPNRVSGHVSTSVVMTPCFTFVAPASNCPRCCDVRLFVVWLAPDYLLETTILLEGRFDALFRPHRLNTDLSWLARLNSRLIPFPYHLQALFVVSTFVSFAYLSFYFWLWLGSVRWVYPFSSDLFWFTVALACFADNHWLRCINMRTRVSHFTHTRVTSLASDKSQTTA
jgi:hypothetical protein